MATAKTSKKVRAEVEAFTTAIRQKPPAQSAALPTGMSTDEARLNKTERAWLAHLRSIGIEPFIQAVTLKLGYDTRYCPDFAFVDDAGHLTFWEVKGFMRDDARVKVFVAARLFPRCQFFLVRKVNGRFESEVVKP